MSERLKKILLSIIVLAYVLSPVDFMPGFIGDDVIVAIIGYLLNRKNSDNNKIDKKENLGGRNEDF